jgi:ribosomal RNA-processing protein 17
VAQANGDITNIHGGADNSSSDDDDDDDDEEEKFTGFAEPEPINQEDEYIDEDKYTTVTVESVNISKAGFHRPGEETEEEAAAQKHRDAAEKEAAEGEGKKKVWTKAWPKNNDKPKKKKKKFRYETKTERKAERMKQGIKKRKQKEARTSKAA